MPSVLNGEEYNEIGEQRHVFLVFQQRTGTAAETSALLPKTLLITGTEISRLFTLTALPPLKVPQQSDMPERSKGKGYFREKYGLHLGKIKSEKMIRVSDPISLAKNQYTKFSMIENSFTRKLSQRRNISLNALLMY